MMTPPNIPDLPEKGAGRPDPETFGQAIAEGVGINLLVPDIAASARWQQFVLGATVTYWDDDFAILTAHGAMWMLHHDRTYRNHPLSGIATGADGRGAGAELRLYGCDPDQAEGRVGALDGFMVDGVMADGVVLAGAMDKPHGVREAFLIDPAGYCWVPTVSKRAQTGIETV